MSLTMRPKQDIELPPLREDLRLIAGASAADGSPTWVIVDPIRGKYFQIGWDAYQILSRWSVPIRGGHPRADPRVRRRAEPRSKMSRTSSGFSTPTI